MTVRNSDLMPDHCDVCGRRNSWGCGHDNYQRRAAVAHRSTRAHREGRCACYVDRPGYFAPERPAGFDYGVPQGAPINK